MTPSTSTRRDFLRRSAAATAAATLASSLPLSALAKRGVPQRPIPSTGEMLPVIGLGSSKVVEEIATKGSDPPLLTTLTRSVVGSTWILWVSLPTSSGPRSAAA